MKEGLDGDNLSLAIQSIEFAIKDKRMTKRQVIALQDALSYARYIQMSVAK